MPCCKLYQRRNRPRFVPPHRPFRASYPAWHDGRGGVKLAGLIELMTGYPAALRALLLGIIFGGIATLALLLVRRAGRGSTMAYAPFLALGAFVTRLGVLG